MRIMMSICLVVALLLVLLTTVDSFTVGGRPLNARLRLLSEPHFYPVQSNNKWISSPSSTQLSLSTNDNDDSPWYSPVSIPYAAALVVFVGFAAFLAPGEFGSTLDNEMLLAYIENPTAPDLNPIFNAEFNLLGAAPLVLAGLILPQQVPDKGVPAGPFLATSAFAGYGGLAPYMIFRKGPRESVSQSSLGWIGRNVFENKIFNLGVLALCLYQYYTMAGPLLDNPSSVWNEFSDLLLQSKFASVSSLDLVILSLTGASVIPLDYSYRKPDSTEGNIIGMSTLLLPILGAAIYCAVRPRLPQD